MKMLDEGKKYIGQKEVPGTKSNPWILSLWAYAKWLGDDDSRVAWCGLFMRKLALDCGFAVPKAAYRARSWLDWGVPVPAPVRGCVVIFERGGAGHVALVDAFDANGNIRCLGGNQKDGVTIAPFSPDRVLGYRVPYKGYVGGPMPRVAATGTLSSNEA